MTGHHVIALLLALAGLAFGVAAVVEDAKAARPAPAPVERLNQELTLYMQAAGYPVPPAPVTVASDREFRQMASNTEGMAGIATAEGTVLRGSWLRYETAGGTPSPDLVDILIHEGLHRLRATDGRYLSMDRGREEGVVSAVTADLTRRWYARGGWTVKLPPTSGYRDERSWIRKLSARATGSPWNSAPARRWRRALLLADEPTRDAMAQAVTR